MKSKFKKWKFNYDDTTYDSNPDKDAWNAACKSILNKIKYKNKMFENLWQEEDISILCEEIREMIEK